MVTPLPQISSLSVLCAAVRCLLIWVTFVVFATSTAALMFTAIISSYSLSLVGGSLAVDWLFLPSNFGPVVGTYKGLLLLCECTGGGDNQTFCGHRWWGS